MEQEQLTLFPSAPMPKTWVYVLARWAPVGQIYKIGYSVAPASRARTLRARLITMMPGGRMLERQLHRRFEEYRFPGTEWFLPARPLIEWIEMHSWN